MPWSSWHAPFGGRPPRSGLELDLNRWSEATLAGSMSTMPTLRAPHCPCRVPDLLHGHGFGIHDSLGMVAGGARSCGSTSLPWTIDGQPWYHAGAGRFTGHALGGLAVIHVAVALYGSCPTWSMATAAPAAELAAGQTRMTVHGPSGLTL
jgi:hypothetical protein